MKNRIICKDIAFSPDGWQSVLVTFEELAPVEQKSKDQKVASLVVGTHILSFPFEYEETYVRKDGYEQRRKVKCCAGGRFTGRFRREVITKALSEFYPGHLKAFQDLIYQVGFLSTPANLVNLKTEPEFINRCLILSRVLKNYLEQSGSKSPDEIVEQTRAYACYISILDTFENWQ